MDGAVHGSSNDDDRDAEAQEAQKVQMHQLTLQVLRNLYQQIPLPPVEKLSLWQEILTPAILTRL